MLNFHLIKNDTLVASFLSRPLAEATLDKFCAEAKLGDTLELREGVTPIIAFAATGAQTIPARLSD